MEIEQYIYSIYNKLPDTEKIQFKEELSALLDFEGSDLFGFLDMWEQIGYFNSAKKWLVSQDMGATA